MLHLSSLFRFAEVLKELFQAGANVLDNDGTASHDVQVVVKRGEKDGEGGRIWSFFFCRPFSMSWKVAIVVDDLLFGFWNESIHFDLLTFLVVYIGLFTINSEVTIRYNQGKWM